LKDEKRPTVARCWKDIFERPAWQKVVNGVPESTTIAMPKVLVMYWFWVK